MKTKKTSITRSFEAPKVSKSSKVIFDKKMARANEAVKKEGLSEMIAEVKASRNQKD